MRKWYSYHSLQKKSNKSLKIYTNIQLKKIGLWLQKK
jgi:hypothetical protein